VVDTGASDNRNRGQERFAPHVKRANAIKPKLLADNGEYVFGIARHNPNKPPNHNRIAAQHQAFMALVEACAQTTTEPTVNAVLRFLQDTTAVTAQLPSDFDPAATLTFRVITPDYPEGVL